MSRTKRQRYEAWRRRTLGGLKLGKKLVRMLMWTVVPAAIALHVSACMTEGEGEALFQWRGRR